MKARTLEKYFRELKLDKSLEVPVFFDLCQFLIAYPDFSIQKKQRDGKTIIEILGKFRISDDLEFPVRFQISDQYPVCPPTTILAFNEPIVQYDQRFITQAGKVMTDAIIKWVPYETTLCHLGRAVIEFIRVNSVLKTHSDAVSEVVSLGKAGMRSIDEKICGLLRVSNLNFVEKQKMSIVDKAIEDIKLLEYRIREANEAQRSKNRKFEYDFGIAKPDMEREAAREGYEEARAALRELLMAKLINPVEFAEQTKTIASDYFEEALYPGLNGT